MVKKISEAEFSEVKDSAVAVVDFSATWCGPCKMVAPVLEEISDELTDINFFNVDVDECQDIAVEYGIQSIPAIAVFKNGERVATNVGFVPKQALTDFINGNK